MTSITTVDRGPHVVARRATVHAPAEDLFALVNDPRLHATLDGSGTVRDNVTGPATLTKGAKFTTKMRMYGVPYRITCTVTDHVDTPEIQVVESTHPAGHRWRWELAPLTTDTTEVTESFDNRPSKIGRFMEIVGMGERNADGITATLERLISKYEPTH